MIIISDNGTSQLSQLECFHISGMEVVELRSSSNNRNWLSSTGNFHLLMGFFFFFWDGGTYSNLINVSSPCFLPLRSSSALLNVRNFVLPELMKQNQHGQKKKWLSTKMRCLFLLPRNTTHFQVHISWCDSENHYWSQNLVILTATLRSMHLKV